MRAVGRVEGWKVEGGRVERVRVISASAMASAAQFWVPAQADSKIIYYRIIYGRIIWNLRKEAR